METDKTTLKDLAIFNAEEDFSVFRYLDCTLTSNGREQLRRNMAAPLHGIEAITNIQNTIRVIDKKRSQWPKQISNGTIMVIERFYSTSIDALPQKVSPVDAFTYKLFHGPDHSLVKYSVSHCFDLIKGMKEILGIFADTDCPPPLKKSIGSNT